MGRLALPAQFSERLGAEAFITQGFDHNLLVLPFASFSLFAAQIATLSKTDPLARLLTRLVLGNATPIQMEAGRRVSLPQALRDFCGIAAQAVVVGGGDLIEVWSPASWDVQQARLRDAQLNAERFAALNLTLTV